MKTKESTDEPVTFVDVYQEFDDTVASKHKIMKFKSRVCSLPSLPVFIASSDHLCINNPHLCTLYNQQPWVIVSVGS